VRTRWAASLSTGDPTPASLVRITYEGIEEALIGVPGVTSVYNVGFQNEYGVAVQPYHTEEVNGVPNVPVFVGFELS